jgi:hypothetical protein
MTATVREFKAPAGAGRAFRKDVPSVAPKCQHCERVARLTNGAEIYPHRTDLAHKRFWKCDPCAAFVGCHPPKDSERGGMGDGTVALGRPANHELRNLRKAAHAAFDPMFRESAGRVSRRDAYTWLAGQLGMSYSECHIGHFTALQCQRVLMVMDAHFSTSSARKRA